MMTLFPLAELAMIATAFAAMGVLVAYAAGVKRRGQSHGVFRLTWRN